LISQDIARKLILYIAILLSISLPISRGGINIFGFLLFVVWILEAGFKEKFNLLIKNKFTLSLIIFLIYQVIVLLWVEPKNINLAIEYSFKYVYFLIVFVLYTSYDPKKTMFLFYGFLFGMFISSIESYSLYFHIYNLNEVNKDSLSPHMWHTIYSIFLSFSSLSLLSLMLYSKEKKTKIAYYILFNIVTIILLLGISRTGQAIFMLGLFLVIVNFYKLNLKSFILISALITSMSIALYTQNNIVKYRVNMAVNDINIINNDNNYCSSLGGRIFTWKVAYKIFKTNPLLGIGTVDHLNILEKAKDDDIKFSKCEIRDLIRYYHSQYIELLAQSGLIGVFLLLSIFYTLLSIPIKNKSINSIKLLLIFVFLTSFLVDVPFRKMFTLALFAIISSIVILQNKSENLR
jgi:O-antigen ligase